MGHLVNRFQILAGHLGKTAIQSDGAGKALQGLLGLVLIGIDNAKLEASKIVVRIQFQGPREIPIRLWPKQSLRDYREAAEQRPAPAVAGSAAFGLPLAGVPACWFDAAAGTGGAAAASFSRRALRASSNFVRDALPIEA